MATAISRKKPATVKTLREVIPPIVELRKQAHDSLDSLMTAALTDDHALYQMALMNLTDLIALIRFSEPETLEDYGGR